MIRNISWVPHIPRLDWAVTRQTLVPILAEKSGLCRVWVGIGEAQCGHSIPDWPETRESHPGLWFLRRSLCHPRSPSLLLRSCQGLRGLTHSLEVTRPSGLCLSSSKLSEEDSGPWPDFSCQDTLLGDWEKQDTWHSPRRQSLLQGFLHQAPRLP